MRFLAALSELCVPAVYSWCIKKILNNLDTDHLIFILYWAIMIFSLLLTFTCSSGLTKEPDSSVMLSEKNRNGPAYSKSVSGEWC
jgi:hypothetical protein